MEIAGPFDTPAAAFLPKSHGCGTPPAEVEPAVRRPAGQAQRQLAPPPDPECPVSLSGHGLALACISLTPITNRR